MTADPAYLQFRDVLYEALAGAAPAVADMSPMDTLRRVSVAAFRASPDSAPILRPLNDVAAATSLEAAVSAAQERYEDAAAFGEAIYFARCLGRNAAQTSRLADGRRYLEEAVLSDADDELATDRLTILELATFQRGWLDPMRIEGSLSLIRLWRQEYARVYEAAHETYHAAVVQIFEQMEELHSASSALRRLNGLRRLGPPLASAALTQHQELERLLPCPATRAQLDAFLADAPFCGECGFRIGQIAPAVEAQRITTALQRGLAGQQTRLARRVIGRLLALPAEEPEARLQRFIEVVQASDLNGLAGVLDDELIGFLDDLLAGHDGHEGVLQQLARRYPEISAGEIDAVVEEFRRLLTDEAAREGIVRLRASGEGRSS